MTKAESPPLSEDMERMIEELDLSEKTKHAYRYGLKAFITCCDAAPITEDTLDTFYAWLKTKHPGMNGAPSRTAKAYLVAARRYLGWLDLRGLLPPGVSYERMVRRLKATQSGRRLAYKQRPTDSRVLDMLTYYVNMPLPEKGPGRLILLRNRALVAFLYDTATRISEALALTRADVQDGRATKIRLTETKNGKPRTVFVGESARALLQAYTSAREDTARAPLFVSHGRDGKGLALTASRARQIIKEAAKACDLMDTTSPHSLRHKRAQDLLDEGMPLQWVAALLGHEHTDTTRIIYAFETDEDQLQEMVETFGKR